MQSKRGKCGEGFRQSRKLLPGDPDLAMGGTDPLPYNKRERKEKRRQKKNSDVPIMQNESNMNRNRKYIAFDDIRSQ